MKYRPHSPVRESQKTREGFLTKPMVVRVVKKLSAFYGTSTFVTVSIKIDRWSLT
jgi:hypothetical protein